MCRAFLIPLTVFCLVFLEASSQAPLQVQHAGAMMKVRQGNYSAAVMLDTLPKEHLFAIGPEEDLRSEIIAWDGRIFRAGVLKETGQPFVEKDAAGMKAVFLVWAQVPAWDTLMLGEPIHSMGDLEKAIGRLAHAHGTDTSKAFPFLLFGKVKMGKGHIMDKDPAITETSAAVSEAARRYFPIENQKSQFVGFYSHHHQRIFTHHDAYIHVHYRLYTKYHAGHLDEVSFDEGEPVRLLLPKKE